MSNVKIQITRSNSLRYSNSCVVDEYLQNNYHRCRVEIALKLFSNGLNKANNSINQNKISVLELAASSGDISEKLMKMGYNVIASDIDDNVLLKAKEKGLKVINFDVMEPFPFDNDTFDGIFAGEIIEHIYDVGAFLSECNRILKKNGLIVLTTPNLATLQDRIKFLFGVSPRQIDPLHEYICLHIRPFTLSKLKEVLAKKGFKTQKVKSNFVSIRKRNKRIIDSRLFAILFPQIGGSLILAASKVN